MRRIAVLALLVGALWVGTTEAAFAHNCANDQVIPFGQTSTVQVGITIPDHGPDEIEVPRVVIAVPPALRIDRVDPKDGWTITQDGQTVEFNGPAIKRGDPCPIFYLGLTPTEAGVYQLRITQYDAAGTVVGDYGADPTGPPNPLTPTVYAGVDPPSTSDNEVSVLTIAGGVLIGVAFVSLIVMLVRNWRVRRAEARDAELQDRLEQFKKQARDRQ